jgi:hypothetical protein
VEIYRIKNIANISATNNSELQLKLTMVRISIIVAFGSKSRVINLPIENILYYCTQNAEFRKVTVSRDIFIELSLYDQIYRIEVT